MTDRNGNELKIGDYVACYDYFNQQRWYVGKISKNHRDISIHVMSKYSSWWFAPEKCDKLTMEEVFLYLLTDGT